MLYEVPELYAPLHQLVFMTDADKGLGSTIEQYFFDACTLVVCSLSWKITKTVVKKTRFKFAHFLGINKNVTVGCLQVQC